MDDIIGEQRKKAFIPISASLLTLTIGVAVSWNALDGQIPDRIPSHLVEKQMGETVGSIGDFLKRGEAGNTSVHPKFNADVEVIQKNLKDQGFYSSKVDGVSGPATEAAIRAYAKENGIAGTANLRQKVLEHIQYNRRLRDAIRITTPAKTGGVTPKTVGLIQTGLSELGYDPGPVDGKIGQKTQDAIRDFQRDRALIPTGKRTQKINQNRKLFEIYECSRKFHDPSSIANMNGSCLSISYPSIIGRTDNLFGHFSRKCVLDLGKECPGGGCDSSFFENFYNANGI